MYSDSEDEPTPDAATPPVPSKCDVIRNLPETQDYALHHGDSVLLELVSKSLDHMEAKKFKALPKAKQLTLLSSSPRSKDLHLCDINCLCALHVYTIFFISML